MGFFDFITKPLNQVGSLVGIRPFSGGPYPDAGMGDRALAAGKPLQAAGQNFLNQGMNLPGLDQMGAMGNLPALFQQYAQYSGVQNPFAPQPGPTGGIMGAPNKALGFLDQFGSGITGQPTGQQQMQAQQNQDPGNPYDLIGPQRLEGNRRAGEVSQKRQRALQALKARMNARGLSSSNAMTAAEAYLNKQFDNEQSDIETDLASQAFEQRGNALQMFMQMMPQLYQMQNQRQMGLAGFGADLLSGQQRDYRQGAAQASANTANNPLGDILGTGLGIWGAGGFNTKKPAPPKKTYGPITGSGR